MKRQYNLKLEDKLLIKLLEYASNTGESVTSIIEKAITKYMEL